MNRNPLFRKSISDRWRPVPAIGTRVALTCDSGGRPGSRAATGCSVLTVLKETAP